MARINWFDAESTQPVFSKYAERMESWQKAIEDGVITQAELNAQADKLAQLLKTLEPKLSDELHQEITNILLELAVFTSMQYYFDTQSENGSLSS